jgi:nucleoside-diphosphate-sugar epimerase
MWRVAILGANGFIGSRIVEMFHLQGIAEVRPVVRRVSSMVRPSRFRLDCRIADGFDRDALASAFAGCEVVIHAIAGDPGVIRSKLGPVYEAAQRAGLRRLIYISTASVHGQAPEPGTTERSPVSDRQPIEYNIEYNNAKVQAERRLLRLHARGAVELVPLRPGIVVGPGSYWVSSFADALFQGEACLIDGGRGICNSIYVDHLVYAIQGAMTNPAADEEAFPARRPRVGHLGRLVPADCDGPWRRWCREERHCTIA